jgi:hypothetical protein
MPRKTRLQQPPAILPDRSHVPLMRALALSLAKFIPAHLHVTITTEHDDGNLDAFVSTRIPY